MKKLAIFLLTVFTMGTAVACGCGKTSSNGSDKIDVESIRIQPIEDNTDCEQFDCERYDGECPKPRMPHKKHEKKLPRPESAYRKH